VRGRSRTKREARRYERSEPRIARREPQKNHRNGGFFVREAARPRKKNKKNKKSFFIKNKRHIFADA
jgi:hypothetical protein